jgi:hypothetical protein
MTAQDNRQERQQGQNARWIPALVPIAVGIIFLLHNFGIIRIRDIVAYWPDAMRIAFAYWPAILIVVGVAMLVDRLVKTEGEKS